jgi:hypothetical protein
MMGIDLVRLPQPAHKGLVFEFVVRNWFGRWMWSRGWGGFTLPLLGFAFIFYWQPEAGPPNECIRFHEWIHIEQWNRPGPFWVQYADALKNGRGYKGNVLEKEAYDRTAAFAQARSKPKP